MTAGVRVTARQSLGSYASSVVGNCLLLLLSFGTSIYLTRVLGAGGFGRLGLVLTVAQTASLFAVFWTQSGFLRYGAEALAVDGSLRDIFWTRMLVAAPGVVAFILLAWPLRDAIRDFHGVGEVGYGLLVLYFLVLVGSLTLQVTFHARGRAGTFAFLQSGERALLLLVLLVLHFLQLAAVGLVVGAYIFCGLMMLAAGFLFVDRTDLLPVRTSTAMVRRFMRFSWPIILAVVASYFASNWLNIVVIRHFHDAEVVGQYLLAYQLMGVAQQFPMASFPVIVPLLVGAYVSDRGASIQLYLDRVVPHAVFAVVVLLGLAILVAPHLVPIIFGVEFEEAARALGPLLLAVAWYCICIIYMPVLTLHERSGSILMATVVAAAVNVVAAFLLIPRWGAVGAAWATLASQAAGALVAAWRVKSDYQADIGPVFLFLAPLALVLAGTLVGDGWLTPSLCTGAAAAILVWAARAQRLGSAPDRRLLAALDLPGLRRLLPLDVRGDAA